MSKIKAGDTVVILCDDYTDEASRGNCIEVKFVNEDKSIEAGPDGEYFFYKDEYGLEGSAITPKTTPTTYTIILEALAGDDIVAQARLLDEALKDA